MEWRRWNASISWCLSPPPISMFIEIVRDVLFVLRYYDSLYFSLVFFYLFLSCLHSHPTLIRFYSIHCCPEWWKCDRKSKCHRQLCRVLAMNKTDRSSTHKRTRRMSDERTFRASKNAMWSEEIWSSPWQYTNSLSFHFTSFFRNEFSKMSEWSVDSMPFRSDVSALWPHQCAK